LDQEVLDTQPDEVETLLIVLKEIDVKTALSKSKLRELDYSLNPYYGCQFSCLYCYARKFTPHEEASNRWGEVVVVKRNLVEVLLKEVQRVRRGTVGLSTITDPYQPVEGSRLLTRRSLEILLSKDFRVSIQTKSPLVLRDLDVLVRHREKVDVGFTVTTLREEVWRRLEPGAPGPKARIEALKRLSGEGIDTWLFMGPVIRGMNDGEVRDIIVLAGEIGTRIVYDKFNEYGISLGLRGDKGWWEAKEREILRSCEEVGIECHSEVEDWIHEERRRFLPLF